jgi:signal transduction histidine kinase
MRLSLPHWPARNVRFGLPNLLRTTTFRLAMVQATFFTAFAFVFLGYIYFATAGQLTQDAERAAAQEFDSLALVYAQGGRDALNQEVIERSSSGGPTRYLFADENGKAISGDFDRLSKIPAGAAERAEFDFEAPNPDGTFTRHHAIGRVGRLSNGPILLVARDMGDAAAIVRRISNTLWTGALLGVALSLLAGLIASRQAARRVETLSRTAQDVMAGDLTRRAPVHGDNDEFDILAIDFNAMLARLEKLVHSTRTAGDAIAHDLRTPLARLRGQIESALETPPSGEADREALRRALEELDQVLATFTAVLRLARVQSASGWRFEQVDVTAITRNLTEFYEPVAEDAGVTLRSFITPGLFAAGDESLITQALSNLIENAIKYTPRSGQARVEAIRGADGRIVVSVADSGPGVPAEDRERILERFVRLETARTTPGAGLGLSLVAAVADLHQAELLLGDGLGGSCGPGLSVWMKFAAQRQRPAS